jgi:aryl sulfotransferase
VDAARFDRMRTRADRLAPDALGVLRDRARFFRRGTSGEGRASLSPDELMRYHARAAELAPTDMLRWLHRDPTGNRRRDVEDGPPTPTIG